MPAEADKLKDLRDRHKKLSAKLREAEKLTGARYERHKADAADRSRAKSLKGREIGPLPPVKDQTRKEVCLLSFEDFCRTYFPQTFTLAFSLEHKKGIAKIEQVVSSGGLFALAWPRGFGKTSLCEVACLWALLYGHRSYVVTIGADLSLAVQILDSIKTELETNDLLLEDFPEVCHPVRELERIAHRCKGQILDGKPTHIVWTSDKLVLPSVSGSAASGGVVQALGLTGSIRGLKHKLPDGRSIRPDLVLPDDPQTDESARSPSQCEYRERLLAGAVLGLAGPRKKISALMPCTVICPGDLADRMTSRKLHPEWNGERVPLVQAFPERMDLWEKYSELRKDSLRAGRAGEEATAFYAEHRAEMDRGAVVTWPDNYRPDEISALQRAMNMRTDDIAAFMAEGQNDPLPLIPPEPGELKPDEIAARVNRTPRGVVPPGCSRLTAFVDVQGDLLYYAVCAWREDFGGSLVAWGAFPDQRKGYFALRDVNPTLSQATGVLSVEGAIYAGLTRLVGELLGREWPQQDGGVLKIEKLLIDSGWQAEVVHRFVRQSSHGGTLLASKGVSIRADNLAIHEWESRPGERRGLNWVLYPPKPGLSRLLQFDSNAWKSTLAAKLWQPLGEPTCFTLYGDSPAEHRLIADHVCAEYQVKTFGRGREVTEWKIRPSRPDNHGFDCIIGCMVAASFLGIEPAGVPKKVQKERRKVSYSELQQRARRGR